MKLDGLSGFMVQHVDKGNIDVGYPVGWVVDLWVFVHISSRRRIAKHLAF